MQQSSGRATAGIGIFHSSLKPRICYDEDTAVPTTRTINKLLFDIPPKWIQRGHWDITDRARPTRTATLPHNGFVAAVAFSPDGHTLATVISDNTAELWDITAGLWDLRGILALSGHLTSWSCAAAGGDLTQEQRNTFAPGIPYRPTC